MTIVLSTLAALALLNTLYVSAIELVAQWLRLRVMSVDLGVGPRLFSIGRVRVRLLPVAGSVTLKDSTAEGADPSDTDGAIDRAPPWARVLLPLIGPLAVALAALVLLGPRALASIGRGFVEWGAGALAPLGLGQRLIDDYVAFAATAGFATLLGAVAAKLAAFNLMPLPPLSGGQALAELLRTVRGARPHGPGRSESRDAADADDAADARPAGAARAQWPVWLGLLLMLSWAVALVVWLLRR